MTNSCTPAVTFCDRGIGYRGSKKQIGMLTGLLAKHRVNTLRFHPFSRKNAPMSTKNAKTPKTTETMKTPRALKQESYQPEQAGRRAGRCDTQHAGNTTTTTLGLVPSSRPVGMPGRDDAGRPSRPPAVPPHLWMETFRYRPDRT